MHFKIKLKINQLPIILHDDFVLLFSASRNNNWATCPEGYFLQGLYRSNGIWLHNIEQATCCRPKMLKIIPLVDCYNHDVSGSFRRMGWSKCRDWTYLVGVYKRDCDKLHCIRFFRCCKMSPPGNSTLNHVDQLLQNYRQTSVTQQ